MDETNREPETRLDSAGGAGGYRFRPESRRGESGLSAIREQRLINRAVRSGWINPMRWDTDATLSRLKARVDAGEELTAKDKALLAILQDMTGADARPRQIAVKNLIAMEAQNQRDEPKEPQQVDLRVSSDFGDALRVAAALSPEERKIMAAATGVYEKIKRGASTDDPATEAATDGD